MPRFCRNLYCSWTSVFAFFWVELLAVLVIQFNANTNKLSAWFSSSNSLLYLVHPSETWMKIHFAFWRKESCSGRARRRTAECWQAGTQVCEGRWGRKLIQLSDILRTPCCMRHWHAFKRWNEGQVFSTLLLNKHVDKTRSLLQPKTVRLPYLHRCSLPCCCSYQNQQAAIVRCAGPAGQANWANFNLAVAYQEPGSHRTLNFWASSVLIQLASDGDHAKCIWAAALSWHKAMCPVCLDVTGRSPAVVCTHPSSPTYYST